jgi:hypothetical protein
MLSVVAERGAGGVHGKHKLVDVIGSRAWLKKRTPAVCKEATMITAMPLGFVMGPWRWTRAYPRNLTSVAMDGVVHERAYASSTTSFFYHGRPSRSCYGIIAVIGLAGSGLTTDTSTASVAQKGQLLTELGSLKAVFTALTI